MGEIFDERGALERVDGDKEFLRELIGICLEDSAKKHSEISQAFSKGDLKTVTSVAHSMKSAYGNVGAVSCHTVAATLERLAKQGDESGANAAWLSLMEESKRFEEFAATY